MPRIKQTAKRNQSPGKAGVSGRGRRNRASDFGAPFPIYTEEEGIRYQTLRTKNILAPHYFDFTTLDSIGLLDKIESLAECVQWGSFIHFQYPVYQELTLEFFTSLRYEADNPKLLWFRLRGAPYELDCEILQEIYGFPESSIVDYHEDFRASDYWNTLTGMEHFTSKNAHNNIIRSPEHLLMHKFMCTMVFDKTETNKCSTKELFLLWCMDHSIPVCTATHVLTAVVANIKKRGNNLGMGYLVSAIADHYEVDCNGFTVLRPSLLNTQHLWRAEILKSQNMELRDISQKSHVKVRSGQASSSQTQQPPPEERTSASEEPPVEEGEAAAGPGWKRMMTSMSDHDRSVHQRLDTLTATIERLTQAQEQQTREIRRFHKYFDDHGLDLPPLSPSPSQQQPPEPPQSP